MVRTEIIHIEGDDGICTSINKFLSRYHSLDGHFDDAIREGYLWFSDPLDFNDPYDCNMQTSCDCSYEEVLSHLTQLNLKNEWRQTEGYIIERANYLYNNPSDMMELLRDADLKTIARTGICCFSQRNDTLLMWSHYANKHKGVCMTFDMTKLTSIALTLYNVEYPKVYPSYNVIRDSENFKSLRFLIATKSQEWEYEDEVRIIRDDRTMPYRGKVLFNKKALVSIDFGYKTSIEEVARVTKLLNEVGGYEHVNLYKAQLKEQAFGLVFNKLNLSTGGV